MSLNRLHLALPADCPSFENPLRKISEESLPRSNYHPRLKGYAEIKFLLETIGWIMVRYKCDETGKTPESNSPMPEVPKARCLS